ncbi:MFS transporter [Pseudonocardia phyllosphaerae]|uniref:MFS transporter n=1 Tax=Pseudonocardia phyllosphaerae TaxID=3390502 RepID=UPI0039782B58
MTTYVSTVTRWWVLTGVSIVSFLGCLDLTIVNTAGPEIGRDLGADITTLQLVVNIVVVALSMFMVTAGRVGDLLGRRTALYIGTVAFGVASLAAGFAPTAAWLIGSRFVQGAACAFLYTSSSTIVSDVFGDAQRGRAIGTLFAVNGLGLAAGPLLGGLVVGSLGWPWIFWLNVPLALLSLAICLPTVPPNVPDKTPAGLDWPGLALLTLGLSGLLFGLTFFDLFPITAWSALAVGALTLLAFVQVERRVPDPIVPFALLRRPLFLAAITAEFALAFFYTTVLFLTPFFLGLTRGLDAVGVGLWMLPITATMAVLSPLVGRVVERVGPVRVIAAGFLAFLLSAALQIAVGPADDSVVLFVAFACMGVGWACVLGPSAVAALSSVPTSHGGLAVGAGWTFHNVGGAIGLALSLGLYRAVSGTTSVTAIPIENFVAGHRAALALVAVVATVASVAVLLLGRSATRPGSRHDR